MKGIFYLLLAYLIGDGLSRLIGGFMPGSVLGMLVLFGALECKIVKREEVAGASTLLLRHMILFFVPIGVGLIAPYRIVGFDLLAIAATLVITTLLVIAVVGWMQQKTGGQHHA